MTFLSLNITCFVLICAYCHETSGSSIEQTPSIANVYNGPQYQRGPAVRRLVLLLLLAWLGPAAAIWAVFALAFALAMKQVLALAAVLIIAGATLYYAQHRKHADAVSANA